MTTETKSFFINDFVQNVLQGTIVEQKVLTSLNAAKDALKTDPNSNRIIEENLDNEKNKVKNTDKSCTEKPASNPSKGLMQNEISRGTTNFNLTQTENREIQQQMFDVQGAIFKKNFFFKFYQKVPIFYHVLCTV